MLRKNKCLRTCLYSNKQFDKQELLRLVKMNNKIILDVHKNMPGRGYWIKPTAQALNDPKVAIILSKRTKCSVSDDLIKEIKQYEEK